MKPYLKVALAALAMFALQLEAATPAVALGKAADNHIYGQKLVFETMARNPDLLDVHIHGIAPGTTDQKILASTKDNIGEPDQEEDFLVVKRQHMLIYRSLKDPTRFTVFTPLKNASRTPIGVAVFTFRYEDKFDETHYCARALDLRQQLASRIPSLEAFMQAAK
jgi:hypothetical protein